MKIRAITLLTLSALCSIGLLSAADVLTVAVTKAAPSQEQLSAAVGRGDVTAVRELLLRGGVTLPTDSMENDVVLPELLQAGVDITRRRHGVTAAEYAVQQGCYFAGKAELSSQTQPNP